jgi:hypothetical protein
MPETVVIGYEKGSDMNLDYYLNSHVPMVRNFIKPYTVSGTPAALSVSSTPFSHSALDIQC